MNDTRDDLISRLHRAENKLQNQITKGAAKWDWPRDAVEDVQELAAQVSDIVSDNLDNLLHWPRKGLRAYEEIHSDCELFYEKKLEERFDRGRSWFCNVGFNMFEMPYTIADNWDRQFIYATFLVPKNIVKGDIVPVIWFLHGGGLVTGAGDHIPWYSRAMLKFARDNKAIVIAPDYPLGPEANYHDISRALEDFLRFYRRDGCFAWKESHWTQCLASWMNIDFTIDKDNLFIEGESAGAHAILTTLFHNAKKMNMFKLPVKVALLRYPMIRHYNRPPPENKTLKNFMGYDFSMEEVQQHAQAIKSEILKLEGLKFGEQRGFVRTRSKGYAPEYMWPAPVLSFTGIWQWLFQREHSLGALSEPRKDDPWNLDGVEKVQNLAPDVDHKYFPPIVIHQAENDTVCPTQNTRDFVEALHEQFPMQYPRKKNDEDTATDEKVYLIEVADLLEKDGKKKNRSKDVGHGYDYWQLDEPFITKSYEHVSRFWPAK